MSIRNVEIGEALHDKSQLATKGVFTCVAVLIFLQDDGLFLAHIGSEIFDIGGKDPLVEVQRIIENAIIMFDTNHKDTVPESIFLMGGVQNKEYVKLNDALTDWRLSPSIIGPSCEIISSQRLRTFIEKIKYHNLCINFIENSISVGDIIDSTWISDVSIVCNKILTSPLIAICHNTLEKILK
ncbi:unnamed protein product [Adineta ricciae]|uniref:Uncharacterized protein n=1 Tax=Adineta ricciae TaxID=249248 RepID=A0A815P6L7_ADIRI|nr:unnamed protein product [Adineta ricciae]